MISFIFFSLEDKAPWTSWKRGRLILEDLQTLHIPTNKKLEVWTHWRLLHFFQENFDAKGDF